ncbi:MAG: histidine phosphatase family protein [Alphaproteobacteria bacterium]|nr:histidine phosphatase family protein [Alphaproteobacteria bacterium]
MYFVRHGQSEFNVVYSATLQDPGIRDAPITKRGADQALGAAKHLKSRPITKIICSPYTRALQTADIIAKHLGIKEMMAEPLAGERRLFTCDIGTPLSQLRKKWPSVDFTRVENAHSDNNSGGRDEWWPASDESDDDIARRVNAFAKLYTGAVDAHTTLVVSHWYFIFTLSGKDTENAQIVRLDEKGIYHREGL